MHFILLNFFSFFFTLSNQSMFFFFLPHSGWNNNDFLIEWIVLDASGSVGSGFVWGNNYWLGSKKACELANSPVSVVLSKDLPKNHVQNLTEIESRLAVEYKLTWAKHRSQWQLDITTFEKVFSKKKICFSFIFGLGCMQIYFYFLFSTYRQCYTLAFVYRNHATMMMYVNLFKQC